MPHALREALLAFSRTPLLTGVAVGMIALSLLVVGLFGIAAYNVRQVLDRVEARVEVVAYLKDDATPEAVRALWDEMRARPEVREVLYISREQALEIAKRELSDFHGLFAELESNPLPASLELRLKPGQRNPQVVQRIAQRFRAYTIVEDVRYGSEWLDKVFLLRRVAGAAALVLGLAFAAVAALIIGAAVRMAIFARRQEISIMRLVGATDGFIRGPFLLEGLMTGLGGGILAALATYGIYRVLSERVVQLAWIPDLWLLGGLFAGALLGVLASTFSVHRHLREI